MAERSGFIAAVHSVHSLVCWLSFPALLVIRNAAVNVPVHDLCGPVFAFLGGGLLGCAAPVSFWGAVVCFLTWLPHLTSYWQCEGSNFCASPSTLVIIFLIPVCVKWITVALTCIYFCSSYWCWTFFQVLYGHLYGFFLGEVFTQIFWLFKLCFVSFLIELFEFSIPSEYKSLIR